MRRREILKCLAAASAIPLLAQGAFADPIARKRSIRRVRPSDPSWPKPDEWAVLNEQVEGNLIPVTFPIDVLKSAPQSALAQQLKRDIH